MYLSCHGFVSQAFDSYIFVPICAKLRGYCHIRTIPVKVITGRNHLNKDQNLSSHCMRSVYFVKFFFYRLDT